ncbi:MAG: DNA alkylation repair protein [Bacteroidales bacterium]|nr:DNA alkylation repair protein [Bacteroidales bacterium]
MREIVELVRRELIAKADKKTRISGERFFREEVKLYGVRSAVVSRIGKEAWKNLAGKSKKEIFSLCEDLWKSGIMEESFVACNWSYYVHKKYEPEDIEVFKIWIENYVSNWASCDTLCNHSVGTLAEMYPGIIEDLKTWTASPNRWLRRASAVSLIIPARKGLFSADIFEIADRLLQDRDDMVRKGYGWMLKSASQARQKEVFDYVYRNKEKMPRTSLRYAIEKMPAELRKRAMEKGNS